MAHQSLTHAETSKQIAELSRIVTKVARNSEEPNRAQTTIQRQKPPIAPPSFPQPNDANVMPTYSEIAKKNLPQSFRIPDQYDQIMTAKRGEFSNGNFVRSETQRGPLIRDDGTASKTIKVNYGSGMQQQRISELVKALRSILPPQATRGFSIFGRDCSSCPWKSHSNNLHTVYWSLSITN